MDITILHNPKCSTSRATLQMIREAGYEPVIVDYLRHPLSAERIREILAATGLVPRQLIRRKEPLHRELGLDDMALGDEALIAAMAEHPILIERPVVITPKGARLCRPKETVLEIL